MALLNAIIHLNTLKQQSFLKLEFQNHRFGTPGVTDTGRLESRLRGCFLEWPTSSDYLLASAFISPTSRPSAV